VEPIALDICRPRRRPSAVNSKHAPSSVVWDSVLQPPVSMCGVIHFVGRPVDHTPAVTQAVARLANSAVVDVVVVVMTVVFFVPLQLVSAVDMILPHAPATVFNELYPSLLRESFQTRRCRCWGFSH